MMSRRKQSDRVFVTLGCRSMAGMTEGISKLNQDSFFTDTQVMGEPGISLVACYDGHGMEGHRCSNYLKSNLPSKFFLSETKSIIFLTIFNIFFGLNVIIIMI